MSNIGPMDIFFSGVGEVPSKPPCQMGISFCRSPLALDWFLSIKLIKVQQLCLKRSKNCIIWPLWHSVCVLGEAATCPLVWYPILSILDYTCLRIIPVKLVNIQQCIFGKKGGNMTMFPMGHFGGRGLPHALFSGFLNCILQIDNLILLQSFWLLTFNLLYSLGTLDNFPHIFLLKANG